MSNAWVMQPQAMTVTSGNTASGYAAANVADDRMGLVWKSTSVAAPKLSIDLGATPPDINWIVLFGIVPGGATLLKVRAADDSGFTTNVYDSGNITLLAGMNYASHGYGVGWWDGITRTQRYWELTFSAASGNVTPQVARVAMGKYLQLGKNYVVGAGYGVRSQGSVDFNRYGSLLRSRGAKMRTIGISYTYVTKDEFQNNVQPLVEALGSDEPIILCTDPAVDENRQKRCYIGPPTGDLGTVHRQLQGWEWKLQLTDLVAVAAGPIILPAQAVFPATLFGVSDDGAIFDPSDLTTMYQDSAGTIAAAVNSPVGKIRDISGKGRHATQATAGARPILKSDGSGHYWLEFDGVDDALAFTLGASTALFDRVGGWRRLTAGGNVHVVSGGPALGFTGGYYMYAGATLGLGGSSGVDTVVTERSNGASSRGALDNGSYTSGTNGAGGGSSTYTLGGTTPSDIRMYRMVMRVAQFTDAEIALLRTWVGASQGRVL